MKPIQLLFITLISTSIAITSCKKDSSQASSIIGYWQGSYQINQTSGTLGLLFKTDSTCRLYYFTNTATDTANANKKADGKYSVKGMTVKTGSLFTPQGDFFRLDASLKNNTIIEGDFASNILSADFTVHKQ